MYYIYALIDPRTDQPGYVGITNNPKARYSSHLSLQDDNREKNAWIQRLKDIGTKPSMKILETVLETNIRHTDGKHPPCFKRLDDEWEEYQREMIIKEITVDKITGFTSLMCMRFPSKRTIIPLWKTQKLQELTKA